MRTFAAALLCLVSCLAATGFEPPRAPRRPARATGANVAGYLPRDRAPAVGDSGWLVARRAKIVQVVDGDNAIAEIEWYTFTTTGTALTGSGYAIETTQNEKNTLVWFRMPTAGMVDGQLWKTDLKFDVKSTTAYETARGKRTVFLLVPSETQDKKSTANGKPDKGTKR